MKINTAKGKNTVIKYSHSKYNINIGVVRLKICSSLMIHVEKMETGEGRTFREKPQADPGGAAMTEAEHMR